MTFPTVLNWDHRQFEALMGAQTIWYPCPAENRVMSAHYKGNAFGSLLFLIFHKVVASIQMSWLIFVSCVLFCLTFFSVYAIQFWLWFKRRNCLAFSSTLSFLCKLSFTSWCPQLPSIKDCFQKKRMQSL